MSAIYSKVGPFANGAPPALNAGNLNTLEAGIFNANVGINVLAYGAVADGVTDNTAAFRAAIADAITKNAAVLVPGGTYSFTPASGFILPLSTGVTVRGSGRNETIFKIANASGGVNWTALFGSNTLDGVVDLSGLNLSGFTFDHNATGNPIPAGTDVTTVVRALVQVPKATGVRITNILSLNADSKWVVQLGTTDATKAATQRVTDSFVDISVRNFGVGSVYHDSSAVYFYGDRNTIRGSYIANATAAGAICGVEGHGDDQDIQVTVDGFVSMVNATGCDATTNHGVNIHDCVGRNVMIGMPIWSVNLVGATGYGVNGLTITNNYIDINPDYWSGTGKASPPGNFAHFGIGISDRGASANLPMQNVTITGNTIVYQPASTSAQKTLDAGISLIRAAVMSGTPAPDININVSGNHIDSPLSAGVVVDLNNIANNVHVDDNDVRNPAQMGSGTVGAQYASGVVVKGNFRLCTVDRARVLDDRGTAVAATAVDMSGLTITTSSARVQVMDPVIWAATTKPPVAGPTSAGGITMRAASYGFVAVTGNFNYGSRYTDFANGHEYIQTAAPNGTAWNLWSEVRPEGVVIGAAAPVLAAPTGLPYIPRLTTPGPPTAVPTARAGMTPFCVDSNGKFWLYEGAWKGAATT